MSDTQRLFLVRNCFSNCTLKIFKHLSFMVKRMLKINLNEVIHFSGIEIILHSATFLKHISIQKALTT